MESGQLISRTEPQRSTVGRMDDNVGGERDSSPTPAKLRLRTLDCCSPLGGCLGTEGNAEAPVRAPGGPTGFDVGVTWGYGTSITASQIPRRSVRRVFFPCPVKR